MRWLALLLFVSSVAAAPAIQQDNNDQHRLAFHLDGIQDFPIGVGEPPAFHEERVHMGIATNTATCGPRAPGAALLDRSYHTYYGYAAGGPLGYDADGVVYARERAQASFELAAVDAVDWYLAVGEGTTGAPAVIPDVVVRAVMREGNEVRVGDSGYNVGDVVAQGQTSPATLSPLLVHRHVTHQVWNEWDVYHFRIPMETLKHNVSAGFNVRVDTFMDNPLCADPAYPDEMLMANLAFPLTAAGMRPGMDLQADGLGILDFLVEPAAHGWNFTMRLHDPFGEAAGIAWEDVELVAGEHRIPIAQWNAPGILGTPDGRFHCHCYEGPFTYTWHWNTTGIDGAFDVVLELPGFNSTATAFVDTRGYAEGIGTDGVVAVGSIAEPVPLPWTVALVALALALGRRR